MIHKAKAKCPNGHTVEIGQCNKEQKVFFFFKNVCTSIDHAVLSVDEIQCHRCNTIHMARTCPECNEHVPISAFRQNKVFKDRLAKR